MSRPAATKRERAGQAAFDALWPSPEGRLKLAKLSAAFLRRYAFRTPYPPMLVYEPKSLPDVRRAWRDLARSKGRKPVGLYVHVPFCPTKCVFCNCMSVTDERPASHDEYLDCLDREAALLRFPRGLPIDTLCIGGGTPTLLAPERLRRLFRLLERRFDLSSTAEKMIEVSPFAASEPAMRVLGQWGVNRVTLGVQTTDAGLLSACRRPQDEGMVREAYERLRRHGIGHISVDLLAGLPGQGMRSFRRGLDFALGLKPDSVVVYPFACIRTTPFARAGGDYGARDLARRERMLAAAEKALARAYPIHRPPLERTSDSLQRVDRDFRDGSVVGLGYSSRSYARGRLSYVKENRYRPYMDALKSGGFPAVTGWTPDREGALRSYVVDRLEMAGRLSCSMFRRLYGARVEDVFADEVRLARRHGLLRREGDLLVVPADPRNHERNSLVCGKLFYSREVLSRVWALVVRGRP